MPTATVEINVPHKIFYPGETVTGNVEISATEKNIIKDVELKAVGEAHVRWSEGTGDNEESYYYNENYYTFKFLLWKRKASRGQILSRGTHKFDFSYQLPLKVPATFDSNSGYVRHNCKAVVDVAGKFFDVKCEVDISVGSLLDLNSHPMGNNQILLSHEKTICCWCCMGGTLSVVLNVDHSGYVPGENIIINAECSNRSYKSTNKTVAELIQRITHRAGRRTNNEYHVICSKKHSGVPPGGADIWSREKLLIPPVPPSGLPGCSIIDVEYILKISFSPECTSRDLTVEAPIYIGAFPLRNFFGTFVDRSVESLPNQWRPDFNSEFASESAPSISYFPWREQYPEIGAPYPRRFTEDWGTEHSVDTSSNAQVNKPLKKLHHAIPLYACYKQKF